MKLLKYSSGELIEGLDSIRRKSLFIHNDTISGLKFNLKKYENRPVYLIETLCSINVLVNNGAILLYGGHGGGKTTLVKLLGNVMLGKSDDEIEKGILRGHPHLTEEKIVGTLNMKQLLNPDLLKDGEKVEVIWSDFVTTDWKIIDELNRLSRHAQNIILSLLAEGIIKYQDTYKSISEFTLFSTMNPKDEGNIELTLPFLDRFALAVPVTMTDYSSLSLIGKTDYKLIKRSPDKYGIFKKNIKDIREYISTNITLNDDAEILINAIITESRICIRTNKELNSDISVESGLCNFKEECKFNSPESICNKINNPLSVRAKEDLVRYGKALAWFLGYDKVRYEHIAALAPFAIWHRSKYISDEKTDSLSINKNFSMANQIVNKLKLKYNVNEYKFKLLNSFSHLYSKSSDELSDFENNINDDIIENDLFLMEIRDYFNNNKDEIFSMREIYDKITNEELSIEKLNELKSKTLSFTTIYTNLILKEIDSKILAKKPKEKVEIIKPIEDWKKVLKEKFQSINSNFSERLLDLLNDTSPQEKNLSYSEQDNIKLKRTFFDKKWSCRIIYEGNIENQFYKFLKDLEDKKC